MRTLGQDTVQLDLDQTQFWAIGDNLLAIRGELNTMQDAMRQDASVAAAIGRTVTSLEAQYGEAVAQYQQIRVAVGMSVAPGLSATWVVGAAWIAGAIVALAAIVAYIVQQVQSAKVALAAAQNQSYALQQAAKAQAAGDKQGMNDWLNQAKQNAQDFTAAVQLWLSNNWGVVALGLGGVLIATSFGGKRR